jgi:hypothetical protein
VERRSDWDYPERKEIEIQQDEGEREQAEREPAPGWRYG